MAKKGAQPNQGQGNRRGRNRNRGDNKQLWWLRAAEIGQLPDMNLPMDKLRKAITMAYMFLPGGQIGDGIPNSYPEIFGSMLRAHGYAKDDVVEAMRLLADTEKIVHYADIPDFDPAAENRSEKEWAKSIGGTYDEIYEHVQKLRKQTAAEKKEAKAESEWRTSMG